MPLDNYRNDTLVKNTFQAVTEKCQTGMGFSQFLPVTRLLTITLGLSLVFAFNEKAGS